VILFGMVGALMSCGSSSDDTSTEAVVSGRIEDGLRVLTFDAQGTDQELRVYRGDYVRAELSTGEAFTLEIPALDITQVYPASAGERPYFKLPRAGSFEFRIGDAGGVIEAVEYEAANYREVSAKDAAGLIANLDPLVLDVRTEREFAGGHLENATLIPVQVLKSRLGELAGAKDRPVFVYCRSGNRSTVAAKMLIDAGFEQVINLRRGIVEWERDGLPTVK